MVVVALAGCVDGGGESSQPTSTANVEIDKGSDTGSILGTVLDDEANPVAGVSIAIVETGDETRTVENGTFVFNGLDPGKYSLVAQRLGFESVGKAATVVAGSVVEVLINIKPVRVADPHHETQSGQGFMTCQWSTPVLKSRIACNAIGDEEKSVFDFPVQPLLTETLTETIWEQSSALSPQYIELDHIFDDDCKECNVVKSSPHRHISNDYDDFDKEKTITESYWLPFGNTTQPVIFAFQQKFDVHLTAFYASTVPKGFTAVDG